MKLANDWLGSFGSSSSQGWSNLALQVSFRPTLMKMGSAWQSLKRRTRPPHKDSPTNRRHLHLMSERIRTWLELLRPSCSDQVLRHRILVMSYSRKTMLWCEIQLEGRSPISRRSKWSWKHLDEVSLPCLMVWQTGRIFKCSRRKSLLYSYRGRNGRPTRAAVNTLIYTILCTLVSLMSYAYDFGKSYCGRRWLKRSRSTTLRKLIHTIITTLRTACTITILRCHRAWTAWLSSKLMRIYWSMRQSIRTSRMLRPSMNATLSLETRKTACVTYWGYSFFGQSRRSRMART